MGINGEILIIHNISRYCDGIYECVAFNDVPPAVNRVIGVMVECEYCAFHTRNLSGLSNSKKKSYFSCLSECWRIITLYAFPTVKKPYRILHIWFQDTTLFEIKIDSINMLNILW